MKYFLYSLCAITFLSQTVKPDGSLLAHDRAQAAVMNAAIGDALGRVTEFISITAQIHQAFGLDGIIDLVQVVIKDPQTKNFMAPYTDDTVMSLIVLKTMLEGREQECFTSDIIIERLARSFAELFGDKKYIIDPLYNLRAHGLRNSKAGLELNQLIKQHKDIAIGWWLKRPEKDIIIEVGCGSVMRAWPIGLVFADNIPFVVKLADEQSKITHRHPMARAASVAMAVGVAHAYQGASVDETVQAMIAVAEQFDQEELLYKKHAKKMLQNRVLTADMIARDELLTSDMIRYAYRVAKADATPQNVLGIHNQKQENYRSPQGFLLGWAADEAVAAAVYLFARNGDNVQQAIIEGVNTPGDSDSIASLVGALVGAKTGKVFKTTDLSLLENYDYLNALANSI